jgi:hypothetical protein
VLFVFGLETEIGAEKGKEFLVCRVNIRIRTKIKILSICSVETGVPGEKPLQAKLIADLPSLNSKVDS